MLIIEKNQNKYLASVDTVFNKKKKGIKMYLKFPKNEKISIGEYYYINGEYKKANEKRNIKGFNYRRYLWQEKIYGIVNVEEYKKSEERNGLIEVRKNFKIYLENNIEKLDIGNDAKNFLKGILLSEKNDMSQDLKEEFKNANLSHIIAISGLHIGYISFIVSKVLFFIRNKKIKNVVVIIFLCIYVDMIGMPSSAVRALIMFIIAYIAKFFYRKSNVMDNLFISINVLLLINTVNIENIGMWLSVLGTFGIISLYKKLEIKDEKNLGSKIRNNIILSLSVQVMILPVLLISFNKFSLNFLISNLFTSVLIGPLIVLGIICMVFGNFFYIEKVCEVLIIILFNIVSIISKIDCFNFYIKTPHLYSLIMYYLVVIGILYKFEIVKKWYKKVFVIWCIITICSNALVKLNRDFEIYFIDVGQGDCTYIRTSQGKNVLIDGGEWSTNENNQGEKVLLPYLLNNRITKIDFMIFSHFDSDHCGGLLYILDKIKVENIIIGRQYEDSKNYQNLIKLVKKKKIKVNVLVAGNTMRLDKDCKLKVLWPSNDCVVKENILNNNSLVFKIETNKLSVLFTGDIEENAENKILEKYKKSNNILKSDILKVAHHGSKTSTTEMFLEKVNPKIALIGVGENNKFNHPSEDIISRLEKKKVKIFRTDNMGEIIIFYNKTKGLYKVNCINEY